MAQYQTFPGVTGDSATLDKLKTLRLPSLAGLSFLDVGCNEGFFCGYACFDGAARVVGIDQSALFIERARQRFADCEFLQQSWDLLPSGPFDVILLASSLHYSDDQPALINRLMENLSATGTLVLEIGVASSAKSEWVKVKRGIDERLFPSMPKLREVLEGYAWKHIGPSVMQAGDPVPRHVFHVQRRRPFAYLLLQPPAYGKSTIGRLLFRKAGIRVISGDETLLQVSRGKLAAEPALARLVEQQFSMTAIDQLTEQIFRRGLEEQLIFLFHSLAGGEEFALDSYVPAAFHARIVELVAGHGYLPVSLQWDRVAPSPGAAKSSNDRADAFFRALGGKTLPAAVATTAAGGGRSTVGFVEQLKLGNGRLQIIGWAMDEAGAPARVLEVRLGGQQLLMEDFTRVNRPDVQQHFGLSQGLYGYSFHIAAAEICSLQQIREPFQLFAGSNRNRLTGPLPLTRPLLKSLEQG